MTIGGWITFLLSFSLFLGLFAWCVYKVMTAKKSDEKDLHAALEAYENPPQKNFRKRRKKQNKF